MTGIAMMLKSLGVKIDPTEIESAFAQAKAAIPQIVTAVQEMRVSQQRIEEKLDHLIQLQVHISSTGPQSTR